MVLDRPTLGPKVAVTLGERLKKKTAKKPSRLCAT